MNGPVRKEKERRSSTQFQSLATKSLSFSMAWSTHCVPLRGDLKVRPGHNEKEIKDWWMAYWMADAVRVFDHHFMVHSVQGHPKARSDQIPATNSQHCDRFAVASASLWLRNLCASAGRNAISLLSHDLSHNKRERETGREQRNEMRSATPLFSWELFRTTLTKDKRKGTYVVRTIPRNEASRWRRNNASRSLDIGRPSVSLSL